MFEMEVRTANLRYWTRGRIAELGEGLTAYEREFLRQKLRSGLIAMSSCSFPVLQKEAFVQRMATPGLPAVVRRYRCSVYE